MKKDFKKMHDIVKGCKLLQTVYGNFTGKRWREKLKAAAIIEKGRPKNEKEF